GDLDDDGDLDVVITTNGGPAYVFRNDGGNRNHLLRVRTVGSASNRDGVGAKITITLPGGVRRWAIVKTGSSYLSQSELPVTFGLLDAPRVDRLEIAWPSGRVDAAQNVAADQIVTFEEAKGIVRATPFKRTGNE